MNKVLEGILGKFFDQYDKDKNGQLDKPEFKKLINELLGDGQIII